MQPDENFWKKCEGERIANAYELEQLLGCGAFGGVFRAVQIANGRRLNKKVAVKLMLSGTIQQEELNFALDLPSHQNLVQHFTGNNVEIRGFPMFYLVMELADYSLADFVKKRGGQISSIEAKPIVRDIAQGLKYLHELDAGNSQDKRYVHRDLKLLNVLQVGGVWKIADFGLSKALDRGTMQTSNVMGTPYYIPPELFRNGYVSTKWDMWSLGVMIVQLLTGHFPFEAVYRDELERKIQRENPNLQGVPSEWLDVVKGCLVKDHRRRWAAVDVLKAIKSQPSSQKTQPAHAIRSSSNGFWFWAINIGVISGAGFIIWQSMRSVNSLIISPSRPLASTSTSTPTPSSEPSSVLPTTTSSPSPKTATDGLISSARQPTIISSPFLELPTHGVLPTATSSPSPKTVKDFFYDGYRKYGENNQGAIDDFNEAIRLNPKYIEAYVGRGRAKSDLGDKQGAIGDLNEAIRLNPNDYEAYIIRGKVKFDLGDKQGAISDYSEAIRSNSDYFYNPIAYINRGKVKSDLGDKQGAIADYQAVIRRNPDFVYAYASYGNIGIVKHELGDKEGAIADYNEAIRLDPSRSATYYYNRGLIRKERGEKPEALADFRKASELFQKPVKTEFYYQSRERIKELEG